MINTKTNEIYGKDPVVNANDIRTHILNVDSRFRDTVLEPSTNFRWSLPSMIRNVIRVRITSMELPNSWLSFTKKRGNTFFALKAKDDNGVEQEKDFFIPDGNYTQQTIISHIQAELNTWSTTSGIFFDISCNPLSNQFYWKFLGTSPIGMGAPINLPQEPFYLTFSMPQKPINKALGVFGLGIYLGFSNVSYIASNINSQSEIILSSECSVNLNVDPYIMLCIRDLDMITSKTEENYFNAFTKIPVQVAKGGYIYLSIQDLVGYEFTATSPIDLKTLLIQLVDRNGDLIESCQDFSFTLEILEIMNLELHEHYRNYIWNNSIPRVSPFSRGSAVAGYLPLNR